MTTRGAQAKTALVLTAERMFSEHGPHGVSLRDVSAGAGQRNHSAAQYHFGSREGLIAAVFSNRMVEVDRDRRQRLDEAIDARIAAERDALIETLVEILVRPLADVIFKADGWYGRFLARARWDPVALGVINGQPEAATFLESHARLHDALTHLTQEIRRNRRDQIDSIAVAGLAGWEWSRDRNEDRLDPEVLCNELIATCVAVALVPQPSPR